MASTKVAGSNGARSSGPSPRPTSLTGTPSSRWTAITIPPLAVPSSLVSTMPLTSTTSAKTRAWRRPFCPVVASSTSSTSSTVAFFSTTRLTLPSSSISPTLVCSRPAVSMITASTPASLPSLTASNATLAGSAPSRSARTVLAPTRSPQVCSWSAAAARKVSAAPSRTVSPSPISARASLPQVVVFPVPFTPTISTTAGRPPCGATCSDLSSSPSWPSSSARSSSRTSAGPRTPSTFTLVRRSSTISLAGTTPTSAVISTSSISSQVSSSSRSLDSRFSSAVPTELCERASLARSRTNRPAEGGGRSTSSTAAVACGCCGAASCAACSPPPGGATGGAGTSARDGAETRPRRGRRNSSQPPAPTARTAMTMIRITYSIRLTVSQTGQGARIHRARRRANGAESGDSSRSRVVKVQFHRVFLALPAGLGGLAGRYLLADDGGDAVAAHGDAVQGVAHLHRPALVGDDDELGTLPQLLEDKQQALQVGVVKGRLDLVQHVERRGAGLEDREQVGDGGQRPLAAGQQREPLDLLARRPGLDLDAGGEHVIGLGEHQVALAAGEQPGEQLLELAGGVGVRGGEHLLHPVVHLLDHGEQVTPGLAEVVELGGEERVALGERGVFLQGQRVDLAEPVELTLRFGGAANGRRPVVPRRPRRQGWGVLVADHRHGQLRAVLRDQDVRLHPELLQCVLRELLEAQPVLGAGDLGAVRGADHGVEVGGELTDARPDDLELARAARARRLGLRAQLQRLGHRPLGLVGGVPGTERDGAGHGGLGGPLPAPLCQQGARLALGGRGRGQRVRAAGDRAQPLLGGPDLEPGLHLGVARLGAAVGEVLAAPAHLLRRLVGLVGLGLGVQEFLPELLEPGEVLLGRPAGRLDGGIEPVGLVPRAPRRTRQPAEPPGDLRRGRVGLLPAGERFGRRPAGGLLGLLRSGEFPGRLVAPPLRPGQAGRRIVRRGPQLKQALRPRRAAVRPVGSEQVACPGDRLTSRILPNGQACFIQVSRHHHIAQELRSRLPQRTRRSHQVGRADGIPVGWGWSGSWWRRGIRGG